MKRTHARAGKLAAALVSATALLLTSCSTGTAPAPGAEAPAGAQRTLRFTNFEPEHIAGTQTRAMGEALAKYSDGRIAMEYFWAGSLLPGPEVPSGVSSGLADLGLMLAAYNPDTFKIGNWAGALMSLPVLEHPNGVLQAGAAHASVVLSNEAAQAEFAAQGLKVLAPVVPYAHFDLLCVDPVTDLASARGKRVRVAGEVWAQEAAAVGMQPVNLPPGEIYEGLQRGVIDCVMQHPPGYIGNGAWEVAKHYTPLPFSGAYAYLVMSQSTWDSLDLADQKAVWKASTDYFIEYEKKSLSDYSEWGSTSGSAQQVVWHEASGELIEAVRTHQAKARTEMVAKAPESLKDPAAYIADYESAMAKWEQTVAQSLGTSSAPGELVQAYTQGKDADLTGYVSAVRETIFEAHAPK